jgi:hypothetical protein
MFRGFSKTATQIVAPPPQEGPGHTFDNTALGRVVCYGFVPSLGGPQKQLLHAALGMV